MFAKLIVLAAVAIFGWRLIFRRWPWAGVRRARGRQLMARITQNKQDYAAACVLLGVMPGANEAEIIAAHRRKMAQVHPDKGGTAEQVYAANAARDFLLSELSARPHEEK